MVISCRWVCLALMGFVLWHLLARGAATEGHADALLPMYKICTCIFWHVVHVTRMFCTVSLHALNLKLRAGKYISAAAAVESNGTSHAGDSQRPTRSQPLVAARSREEESRHFSGSRN